MVEIIFHHRDKTSLDNVAVDKFLELLDNHRLGVINITKARIGNKDLNIEKLIEVLK